MENNSIIYQWKMLKSNDEFRISIKLHIKEHLADLADLDIYCRGHSSE